MSPNATNVQRITPNISNLHFHANSEHTRDGAPPSPAVPMLRFLISRTDWQCLVVLKSWQAGRATHTFLATRRTVLWRRGPPRDQHHDERHC